MKYKIQCFGIAREICGADFIEAELDEGSKISDLHRWLQNTYPELGQLRHFFIARNQQYAKGEELLAEADELVIIPPVSGG